MSITATLLAATFIVVPATGTDGNPPGFLGGAFDGPTTTVEYPAELGPLVGKATLDASVKAGVDALSKDIRPGSTVVGTSQGAVVIREYLAAHPQGTPGVTFVSVADPTNSDGGVLAKFPGKYTIPGIGFSTYQPAPATPDNRIEIVREYDPISDFPDHPNLLTLANTVMAAHIHADGYGADADINAPTNLITKTTNSAGGSLVHIVIRTDQLPLTQPLRDIGLDTRPLDAVLKPMVDAGYDRTPPNHKADKKTAHKSTNKKGKGK